MPVSLLRRAIRPRLPLFRLPLFRFSFLFYLACLVLMLLLRSAHAAAALPATSPAGCGVSMSCTTTPGSPAPAVGPGVCGPAAGGTPCSGAKAVASLGNQGGVNVDAGNPINVISGNKYQREEDLPALPGVLGLEIVRHYNSAYSTAGTTTGILGRGWKLSYETDLYVMGNTLQVMQADGTRIIFNRDPANRSLCSTANPANGTLQIVKRSRGEDYTWTWPDGRVLNFNSDGKLVQIVAATGEFVSLQRDAKGLLVQVTDPQGRQLRLQYPDQAAAAANRFGGVATIVSPVGNFSYRYGSALPAGSSAPAASVVANLMAVNYPDNSGRLYHHEDALRPTFLTGISVVGIPSASSRPATATPPRRIATYLYDIDGHAVLTVRGTPARLQTGPDGKPLRPARLVEGTGIGQVVLNFSTPGQTLMTNSLGQTTVYRHAIVGGEFRLLEVRGAGCFQCGEMNMRYGYDKLGRLIDRTQLTSEGVPVATSHVDLDALGRVTRTTRVVHSRGKPGAPSLQARFAYAGDLPGPTLIARPSVVPGKELITQITYGAEVNHRMLPVAITETGFAPAVGGTSEPLPITRTLRYGHDFHGHRIQVDGPLPNAPDKPGPNNSDITHSEFDPATGLLTKTIAPGGIVTDILERDAALRATKIRSSDGSLTQTTGITHNWRGQPTQITVAAAFLRDGAIDPDTQLVRTLTYGYDLQGAISYITLPGNRTSRFVRDAVGRIVQRILPDGSRLAVELDTEDRTRSSTSDTGGSVPMRSERYRYDAQNRMTDISDAIGLREHRDYSDVGQIAALTNALGTTTRLTHDENGLLIARTQADDTPDAARISLAYDSHGMPTAITDPNGATTRRLYDDFGRKIAETSPDRGVTLYQHDLAGRTVARIDETGVTLRYRYDHADRLVAMGVDRSPELVTYTYQGMRLLGTTTVAEADPKQVIERTLYRTNALGQVTAETRWMAKVDAPGTAAGTAKTGPAGLTGLTFTTRYTYDGAGRPTTITLPDQHRIAYLYGEKPDSPPAGGDGNGTAPGAGGALREIHFDDQIVVTGIRQSAVGGLIGYTTGSGIRQQIDIDVRGQIVALRAVTEARRPNLDAAGSWSQIEAWFKRRPVASGSVIYSQANRYDTAGRLIDLRRQSGTATPRWTVPEHAEHFAYDKIDRLTSTDADGVSTRMRYDQGGNRIAENSQEMARRYHYGPGANRLVGLTQNVSPNASGNKTVMQKSAAARLSSEETQQLQTAWFYHPTGVPLAQLDTGAINQPAATRSTSQASRRIVYNSAGRPIAVHDGAGDLIARYFYNSQGERIAKSVYAIHSSPAPAAGAPTGKAGMTPVAATRTPAPGANQPAETTYSLYREQRLSAEADADGHITAHYIYLNGKPIAKIDMAPEETADHVVRHAIAVMKGWLSITDGDATDSKGSVHAIHTDHLGTPQAVTDDQQRIVWQARTSAFGAATVTFAPPDPATGKPYVMNLRLPGQVFDAETGLHQNYYREYDPQLGRYTTPDPMGLAGGMNPYAYVNSNPLTRTDPLGLYEEDVHYYMTYFLALTAGLPEKQAWVIAMADRYIDDNKFTEPYGFIGMNLLARLDYHFTQAGSDPDPKPGMRAAEYLNFRIATPNNPQLRDLRNYAVNAPTTCAKSQLYGEFLHAFQDTFAHRNTDNVPYRAGGGHAIAIDWPGHAPDKTFNQPGWNNNATRTLEMEKETFALLKKDFGRDGVDKSGFPISWEDVETSVTEFNKIQLDEKQAFLKAAPLIELLKKLGLPSMRLYDAESARQCRLLNLRIPNTFDGYPNAILKTPSVIGEKLTCE